jgi:hypothetical protein
VSGLHTVNECTSMLCVKLTFWLWIVVYIFDIAVTRVDVFVEKIRFFSTLILNADEAELWSSRTFLHLYKSQYRAYISSCMSRSINIQRYFA